MDFKKDVEKMVQGLKEGGNLHHLKWAAKELQVLVAAEAKEKGKS